MKMNLSVAGEPNKMKISLTVDGKPADAKDLTKAGKIAFANEMLRLSDTRTTFDSDKQRIQFTDCFFAGANLHAFFSKKKKMLPERVRNACYAVENFTLLKPTK